MKFERAGLPAKERGPEAAVKQSGSEIGSFAAPPPQSAALIFSSNQSLARWRPSLASQLEGEHGAAGRGLAGKDVLPQLLRLHPPRSHQALEVALLDLKEGLGLGN